MDSKVKLIAAAGAAIVALGVTGWIAYSSLGGGRVVRSASEAVREGGPPAGAALGGDGPRRAELAGGPPAWVERERGRPYSAPLDYPDRGDALPAFDEGAEGVAIALGEDAE